MAFVYYRTIRFQDTDAAGVVYFANVLSICHEAYEAALADAGLELQTFFGKGEVAVPIVHADIDFRQPFHCGDQIAVHLTATTMDEYRFTVQYEIMGSTERSAATARTIHICINGSDRRRCPLPPDLQNWLDLHSVAAPSPVIDGG